jgi:glycosyltransferase involved in cell wall biosynthesis
VVEPYCQPDMLTDPTVSVIVPNYNHARFLSKRLGSIFNQTYQNFEVILLDDCSADNSVEVLRSYAGNPRVSHCVVNDQNSGSPFKQWEKGIALARGEYIWIAESDDWAETDFLEKLLPQFIGTIGLVYCRSLVIDENDEAFRGDFFWAEGLYAQKRRSDYVADGLKEIAECLVYRNTIPAASACIMNRRFMGAFPDIQSFKYAGDWLFWIELLKNCRLHYSALPMNKHRWHDSTSRGLETKQNEKVRLREYFRVIRRAKRLTHTRDTRSENYLWIFKELYWHHRVFFNVLLWPPMLFSLRLAYSRYIVAKLRKKVFNTLRTMLRFAKKPVSSGR